MQTIKIPTLGEEWAVYDDIISSSVGETPQAKGVVKSVLDLQEIQKVLEGMSSKKKKEETKMETYNIDRARIEYLTGESYSVYYNKDRELEVKFGLREDKPQSAQEAVDRIKADQFSLRDDDGVYSVWGAFRWNLNKKDSEGYRKAGAALSAAKKVLDDAIMLKSTDEAYKALETFRRWEYQA